jgi:hypothetical protein
MNALLRATFYFLSVFVLTGCSKDEYSGDIMADSQNTLQQQNLIIQEYIRMNSLNMERDFSGMYYKIEDTGDPAEHMTLNSVPTIVYTRRNLQDSLLDASFGDTNFDGRALKDHIVGWQIGLQKIGRGGRIFMIIPSPLAFGNVGVGNIIPANTILVCNVELVDFK